MIGRRLLALTLAGLMVITSVNTGSMKVYAQETDQESNLSFASAEDESSLSEETDGFGETLGGEQSEVITEGTESWGDIGETAPEDDAILSDEQADEPAGEQTDEESADQLEDITEDMSADEEAATDGIDDETKLMSEDYYTLDANGGTFFSGQNTATISGTGRYIDGNAYRVINGTKAFIGWYKDRECTDRISSDDNPWEFKEDSEAGKTYYAGWKEESYKLTYVVCDDTDKYGKTAYYYDQYSSDEPQKLKELVYYIPAGTAIGYSNTYAPESYNVRNSDLHILLYAWYHDSRDKDNLVDDFSTYIPEGNTVFYPEFLDYNSIITIHAGEASAYFLYEDSRMEDYGKSGTFKHSAVGKSENYTFSLDQWYLNNDNPRRVIEGAYSDASCSEESRLFEGDYGTIDASYDRDIYIKWKDDKNAQCVTFDLNADYGEFYDQELEETTGTIKELSLEDDYRFDVKLSDMHYKLLGFSTDKNAVKPDPEWTIEYDDDDDQIDPVLYVYFSEYDLTKSTTLYGIWEKRKGYVITFDSTSEGFYHDYYIQKDITKKFYITDEIGELNSSPVPEAKDPDKVHKGWMLDGKEIDCFNTRFSSDATLKAVYDIAITVTFDANGGKIRNYGSNQYVDTIQDRIAKGTEIYLGNYDVYCDGKEFVGWYAEKECINPISKNFKPEESCTIYAKWIDKYTVTFDYGDGVVDKPHYYVLEVLEGDTVVSTSGGNVLPPDPVAAADNMAFAGWFRDEELTKPIDKSEIENYIVTEDTTFYAKYDEAFTVTFVAENGFVSKSGTQYSVNVVKNETLKGKYPTAKSTDEVIFAGWYDKDNKLVDNIYNYKVTENATFTAGYDKGFYTITFHANHEGALLEGGEKEIKVKVAKGTAFRYSTQDSYSDELFAAPAIDASGVSDDVVPLETIVSNKKVPGWTTNKDGSGRIYVFSASSHVYIEEDSSSRSLGMYGFVPTSDMDFYAKWDEPVRLIFTSNKFLFRNDSRYDVYGELSEDRKQRILKVPKGTTFASIAAPGTGAFDVPGVLYYSYRWTTDEDGKVNISNNTPIVDGTKAFFYVFNESTTYPYNNELQLDAVEGHFSSSKGSRLYTISYGDSFKGMLYAPIPVIDDPSKAFDGWYLDEGRTKRYDDKYQFYTTGQWKFVPPQNVTHLYAGYSSTYSVTLDANGGYFDDSSSRTKDPDEVLRDRTKFVVKASPANYGIKISDYTSRIRRDGNKIFTGWFYEDGTRAAITSDGINMEFFRSDRGTCTLYAGWEDYVPVTEVSINTLKYNISVGESVQLKATVKPDTAKNQEVHWFLNSYSVAEDNTSQAPISITADGLVTGVASGTANVSAIANGVMSEIVSITVTKAPVQPKISIPEEYQKLNLLNGNSVTVRADVTPISKAGEVKWSSADPIVASVEGNGDTATITAGDTEGTTTVTAVLGSLKATISVNVTVPIRLDKSELVLTAGGNSNTLEAIVANPELSQKKVIWTISDVNVATVTTDPSDSKKAVVVPADSVEETSTAIITAALEGTEFSIDCKVTVNSMPKAEMPVADVPAGAVKKGTVVQIKSPTSGALVFYTTDGSEPQVDAEGKPSGNTKECVDGLTIDADITIKAIAFKKGFAVSQTAAFVYTVDNQVWGQIGELSDDDPLKIQIKKHFENDSSKVPEGVWFIFRNGDDNYNILEKAGGDSGISRTYNADKITFNDDIIILNGTGFLVENRDYTLTFANNTLTNAAQKKLPQVTIKGKGIYNSSAVFTFTITPDDISRADITSEHVVTVLAGKGTKLGNTRPTLTYKGKKLALNKDYELHYYKEDVSKQARLIDDPAKEIISSADSRYYIEIAAKAGSNFTGMHTQLIDVLPVPNEKNRVQVSKLKVTDANGKAVKIALDYPGITADAFASKFDNREGNDKASYFVANGKDILTYGKDYTISVPGEDLSAAGMYNFVIAGKAKEVLADGENEYIGEKTCTYEVRGIALNKVKIAGLRTSVEYTGASIGKDDLFGSDKICQAKGWKTITLYTQDSRTKAFTELVEGEDYLIENVNSGVVGKYDLVFTGMGRYTGSVKKVITVKAASFKTAQDKLAVKVGDAAYVKTGARPEVTVTFAGMTLTEGLDYTVNYKNNTKVANKADKGAPFVTVKGIGNYTGTSVNQPFTITRGKVSQVTVALNDLIYKPGKKGYYYQVPKLMDNGKAIAAGKNKDVEAIGKNDYVYTYESDTILEDEAGTVRAGGTTVEATDKIPVGTTIVVTVPVSCSDKSPYIADKTSISGTFRIIAPGKDISKAKVTVADSGKKKLVAGNGEEVKLTKEDLIVTLGKDVTLQPEDYEIVPISNDKGVGTAVFVIEGRGAYGGKKTVSLKITARSMN